MEFSHVDSPFPDGHSRIQNYTIFLGPHAIVQKFRFFKWFVDFVNFSDCYRFWNSKFKVHDLTRYLLFKTYSPFMPLIYPHKNVSELYCNVTFLNIVFICWSSKMSLTWISQKSLASKLFPLWKSLCRCSRELPKTTCKDGPAVLDRESERNKKL